MVVTADRVHAALDELVANPGKHCRSPAFLEGQFVALARLLYGDAALQRALTRAWRPADLSIVDPDLIGWAHMGQILAAALAELRGDG